MVALCACFKVILTFPENRGKREIPPTACGNTAIHREGVQPILVFCFSVTVTAKMMTTLPHEGNFFPSVLFHHRK